MNLNLNVTGSEKASLALARLAGSVARKEMSKGLNIGANKYLVPAMKQELVSRIDRVTPFVEKSVRLIERATPERLSITVGPSYRSTLGSKGGKVGVDPQDVLQAQEFGGSRRDKKSEVALRRVGILPRGMQTAIPSDKWGGPLAGSDDGRGNLRGPFVVQLIAYFQAFGEQGYKANMKDKRKRALERGSSKTFGRRYFVAYGKMRGGARMTGSGEYDVRASNLPAGIWAVVGKTGVDVRPVLMFVRPGKYKPLINMNLPDRIGEIERQFGALIRAGLYEAAGV
jgi:hypothetical protein